jgi:tRNA G18 (ribose-2'-O)-methylase SpoU
MKNFIPRGNKTRKERVTANVQRLPFAAATLCLNDDINVNLIVRSLANFAGNEVFIIGSQKWHKGATNGLENILPIHYFQSINEFMRYMRKTDYTLVAVEQSEKSVPLETFVHPVKPCFILGNESTGIGDDVLLNVPHVVEISMNGMHPNANVGCASAIVFYDYASKRRIHIQG